MEVKDTISNFIEDTIENLEQGELIMYLPEYDDIEYRIKSKPIHFLDYDISVYSEQDLSEIYGMHPDRISDMVAEDYYPPMIVTEWDDYKESLYIDTIENFPESNELLDLLTDDFNQFVRWVANNQKQ